MALLRRGDMSVTEVCFEVGCSSLGTFSTRFTELVGMPPSAYRSRGGGRDGGDAAVRRQAGDPTDQESRSAGAEPHLGCPSWTSPSTQPCSRTTTPRRRSPSTATPSASRSATTSSTAACTGSPSVPPNQPGTSIVLYPLAATPGITDDERRTITEMMAKGTFASINLATPDLDGAFERMQAGDAEVVQEPTEQPYGVRDCAVRDPSGNLVRVQEVR